MLLLPLLLLLLLLLTVEGNAIVLDVIVKSQNGRRIGLECRHVVGWVA